MNLKVDQRSQFKRIGTRIRKRTKRVLARAPFAMTVALIGYNMGWRLRWRLHLVDTDINATFSSFSPQEAADYVDRVYASLRELAGVQAFHGVAAEIGPGGNAGVALRLRLDGCERIDLVDRFTIRSDARHHAAIYDELSRRHGLDRFRNGRSWDSRAIDGVIWHEGAPAEEFFADAVRQGERYDLIFSHTVLQHLYDPLQALRSMVACLRPGGIMIHRIDLRDQGLFSQAGDELAWLTIRTWLWPHLTRQVGGPNRVLAHEYVALLDELGGSERISFSVQVTRLVGVGELDRPCPIAQVGADTWARAVAVVENGRPSFVSQFRNVEATWLAVSGMVLVVTKASE